MSTTKLVSLLPSDMVSGGLISDLDVTFESALFTIFDYQGKSDPRVCLKIDMKDDEGNLHEQYFSAADPKYFAPSDDGQGIVAVSDKGALVKGSNFDGFITSLVNAGMPESALRAGISGIVGYKVHVVRKAAPKRAGIINQAGGDGGREQTVLVVDRIISKPGEAAKAKPASKPAAAAPKATPAAAAPAASGGAGGDDDALTELVQAKVKEAGDAPVSTKELVAYVFKNGKGSSKKAMTQRVAQPDFLNAGMEVGAWLYNEEAGTVEAAPE